MIGVTIIPHTFTNTTLGQAQVGSRLNIEVDVLAKHVEKLIACTLEPRRHDHPVLERFFGRQRHRVVLSQALYSASAWCWICRA